MRLTGRFMFELRVLLLLAIFATPPELFRTGWFVDSLFTDLAKARFYREVA